MTSWTHELDLIWINEMIHQGDVLGKRTNNGFKKEAWKAALDKLNRRDDCNFTMLQLKTRNTSLKEKFGLIHRMANSSGMGFERATSKLICISTSWDAFLEGKSEEMKNSLWWLACTRKSRSLFCQPNSWPDNWSSEEEKDDGGEQVDDCNDDDDAAPSESNEMTQQDTDLASSSGGTKRRRQSSGRSPPKRIRQSAATVLASVLKDQGENLSRDFECFADKILGKNNEAHESKTEVAIDVLQSDLDHVLDESEMLGAIQVISSEDKAKIFLKLRGRIREVWLREQIRSSHGSL
ncbi:hypothetical protein Ae201684_014426 [Aphanomyces euteiches]|uniref:Myb/SANT-like domain-containing protein n=1 Tax=Aphanomyces euteiches TaxID=100861 RepID=A0A6G0WK07_9STRA|nr:hypothetical protein Ae201684_014426 [Aphanomyces euteiches]